MAPDQGRHVRKARRVDRPLTDTSAEAERIQIELLRQATAARRARLVFSLSDAVRRLARRGIRRSRPHLSARECDLLFVGADLAARLRAWFEERDRDQA